MLIRAPVDKMVSDNGRWGLESRFPGLDVYLFGFVPKEEPDQKGKQESSHTLLVWFSHGTAVQPNPLVHLYTGSHGVVVCGALH